MIRSTNQELGEYALVREPAHVSFLDALFMATSAVCVTGLAVHGVATEYTTTGQVVSALIRKGLQTPASARHTSRNGVPIVRRRAGAPVMTMALVNELRDEM